jgi:hypothetical protein
MEGCWPASITGPERAMRTCACGGHHRGDVKSVAGQWVDGLEEETECASRSRKRRVCGV